MIEEYLRMWLLGAWAAVSTIVAVWLAIGAITMLRHWREWWPLPNDEEDVEEGE